MRNSIYNNVRAVFSKTVAAITTDTTTNSTGVDMSQFQNYSRSATVLLVSGVITDGTYSFEVQESDDNSSWAAVPASNLQGAFTNWTGSNDGALQEVGVTLSKRYLRCAITSTATTSGGLIGVIVLCGQSRRKPIARA